MVALPILNALPVKHVATEAVLILVLLTNRVVRLQFVLLEIIRHHVHAHPVLKEILIGNVIKVRLFYMHYLL